jgi:hypothetical protein
MTWERKGGMKEDEKESEELREGKMRASGYCGDAWEEETIKSRERGSSRWSKIRDHLHL